MPSDLVLKNGAKTLGRCSGAMPAPRSMTVNSAVDSPARRTRTSIRGTTACSIDSTAFFSRFSSTCSIRIGSASTGGSRGSTSATIAMRRLAASISAKAIASSTMRAAGVGRRRGSERLTNSRMRRMMPPARCACAAVLASAAFSSSADMAPRASRASVPSL